MYPLVSCDIPLNRCLLSLLISLILICVFLSICELAYAFAICWSIIGSFHNPFDWWQWLIIIIVNTLMIPNSKAGINRRNSSPNTTHDGRLQFICNCPSYMSSPMPEPYMTWHYFGLKKRKVNGNMSPSLSTGFEITDTGLHYMQNARHADSLSTF